MGLVLLEIIEICSGSEEGEATAVTDAETLGH
jgi:hypothetical protein